MVVYKVDRLSRSLSDFARLMETFDKHHVSFVSVTQQFNTATSIGRLVLNILLSFAQFEREIISERTRDKIAATRRKGKWTGGMPILGYDVDPLAGKLNINHKEAARVRAIFDLYLQHGALGPAVQELRCRRWRSKRRRGKQGDATGGRPFTRSTLYRLLTNVTYPGKVRFRGELYTGEQPAVIEQDTWERVQDLLHRNRASVRGRIQNRSAALLQGLLYCRPCGCAMTPISCTRGGKPYRYYLCCGAHRRGRQSCPSKSIPARDIEAAVLEQIQRHHPVADARKLASSGRLELVRHWISRLDFDGAQDRLAITFHPHGLLASSAEQPRCVEEVHP